MIKTWFNFGLCCTVLKQNKQNLAKQLSKKKQRTKLLNHQQQTRPSVQTKIADRFVGGWIQGDDFPYI